MASAEAAALYDASDLRLDLFVRHVAEATRGFQRRQVILAQRNSGCRRARLTVKMRPSGLQQEDQQDVGLPQRAPACFVLQSIGASF
jgi:hypothetical protein